VKKIYFINSLSSRDASGYNVEAVLGRSGANSNSILYSYTVKDDMVDKYSYIKTASEAVVRFVETKKWGYNKPNYKIVNDNTVMVSKWAMGMVIGKGGGTIKKIQRVFGKINLKPLPFEEDNAYCYGAIYEIVRIFDIPFAIKKEKEQWVRISRAKASGGGMYERFISQKGSIYNESSHTCTMNNLDNVVTKDELNSIKSSIKYLGSFLSDNILEKNKKSGYVIFSIDNDYYQVDSSYIHYFMDNKKLSIKDT